MARAVGREAAGARLKPAALWSAATAAAAAFGALVLAVAADNPGLTEFDARLGEALTGLSGAPIGALLSWLSALHAPRGVAALTAIASVALWHWRERAGVLVLLASVLGGTSVNHALKHALRRPRPGLEHALSAATDYSFPSGHVASATLLYGTLAALAVMRTGSRRGRVGVVTAAVLVVACIACSRVVLGAHRVSDVLAGALLGLAWMMVCLALRCALIRGDSS